MKERTYLEGSILLSDRSGNKRTFRIEKCLSAKGASTVCYEARHESSGKPGVLKEFYPVDALTLVRDVNGQLVHVENASDSDRAWFEKKVQNYIEPYTMLLNAKGNTANFFADFIPAFELFYGCGQDGSPVGSAYIWSPETKLETLEEMCSEIHAHPTIEPESKLVKILYAIEALVKCICELHNVGMIHRDIKPQNFGFIKRGRDSIAQAISMFDIDTLCSVYNVPEAIVGTRGYMEPESGFFRPGSQTDIYAIGAVLFHAIVVTEETRKRDYLYCDAYYPKIRKLVNASELLRTQGRSARPELRNLLADILEKCLCERDNRYRNCEALLKDLGEALNYAIPAHLASKAHDGRQLVLVEMDKKEEKNREKNAGLAIQYHLFAHPLYTTVPKDSGRMNVLLLGMNKYGRKFLDICLQTGQMPDKKMHVTVVSEKPKEQENYLKNRPELAEFFNIDGSLAEDPEHYGTLDFHSEKLPLDHEQSMTEVLEPYFQNAQQAPHYVFIACGKNTENLNAAKTVKALAERTGTNAFINFIWERAHLAEAETDGLKPVYVDDDVKQHALYSEIERMALNVHLLWQVWEGNLNIDFDAAKRDFRKPYHHSSCVSAVLSIKDKLHAIGVSMEDGNGKLRTMEAAKEAEEIIRNDPKIRNALMCAEHRRWVAEKLCQGYRRIRDLEECAGGLTRDERNKRHICIVRSRPDQMLAETFTSHAAWDNPDTALLEEMDELDRMSVELHLMYRKYAQMAKQNHPLFGGNIGAIRSLIQEDPRVVTTFQEWFTCLKDIQNEDCEQAKRYGALKKAFLDSVKASGVLHPRNRKEIENHTDFFDSQFFPIRESLRCWDYKKEDAALTDGIPFILTYSDKFNLVIPFAYGTKTTIFGNVAAATVSNPNRITYLFYCRKMQELDELKGTLRYLENYMKAKHFRAKIDFMIGCEPSLQHDHMDIFNELEEVCRNSQHSDGRISRVHVMFSAVDAFVSGVRGKLLSSRRSNTDFYLEKNNTWLSGFMEGAGICREFPSYSFDSRTMQFHNNHQCEVLRYLNVRPYITVTDMAAFTRSSSKTSDKPEYYEEFKQLWMHYRTHTWAWKSLCKDLAKYSSRKDVIAEFEAKTNAEPVTLYRRSILTYCQKAAADILNALKEQQLIGNGSQITSYSLDSCTVIIEDIYRLQNLYDTLFDHEHALMQPDFIKCTVNAKNRTVKVSFDKLTVNNLLLSEAPEEKAELIQKLSEIGCLRNVRFDEDGKKASFSFAAHRIKRLLTVEGKMLEIFTYHKAKETCGFDDIRSSFEIDWENSVAKNEFDCILTKGFSAVFVECKATKDIKPEFYTKLSALTKHFGINAKAVLITDSQEETESTANRNKREHGGYLDVITISNPDEVDNIGQVLLSVLEGSYKSDAEAKSPLLAEVEQI